MFDFTHRSGTMGCHSLPPIIQNQETSGSTALSETLQARVGLKGRVGLVFVVGGGDRGRGRGRGLLG